MRQFERTSIILCQAFGAMLVMSAMLKLSSPTQAAALLGVTELSWAQRIKIIEFGCGVEAVVGACLILLSSLTSVLVAGAALAVILLLGHIWTLISGAEDCGCFGELFVPDWITLTSLAVGLASCVLRARRLHGRARPVKRVVWRVVGVGVIFALAWLPMFWRLDDVSSAPGELLGVAGVTRSERAVFVVGSWGCPHCEEELARIGKMLSERRGGKPFRFQLVTRDGDRGGGPDLLDQFPWLEHLVVADDLWWALLQGAPPAFIEVAPGIPLQVRSSWPGEPRDG